MTARIILALTYRNQGLPSQADEVLQRLEEPAFFSKATPAEQAMIRHYRATLNGNWTEALAAAREAGRLMPGSFWWAVVGLSEDRVHHPRAAAEAYSHIPLHSSPAEAGPAASGHLSNGPAFTTNSVSTTSSSSWPDWATSTTRTTAPSTRRKWAP